MKSIFAILLLAFAVFSNLIEKSLQSGEEPPFPSRGQGRLSTRFKDYLKRLGSSEPQISNENSRQYRQKGQTSQENLPPARENEDSLQYRQKGQTSQIYSTRFKEYLRRLGTSEPERNNENSRQYLQKGQTSQENLSPNTENENHLEEYEHPVEKFQYAAKPLSNSKGSSKPKGPPRDPGDPDDPGVVFWLPSLFS